MSGYVKVSREFFEDDAFAREPFSEREAFLWLIMEAAYKPRTKRIGRRSVVNLGRGELAASIRFMQEAWGWASPRRVHSYLASLKKRNMIDTQPGTDCTVIRLCNYDKYQAMSGKGGTLPERKSEQQRNKLEEGGKKEERETNVSLGEFDRVWAGYPRKVGKGAAEKAWAAARKRADYETIAGPLRAHVRAMAGKDPKFIPHLSTWLNQKRWEDEGVDAAQDPEEARLAAWGIADAKPFRPELTVVEGGYAEPERLRDQRQGRDGDAEDDVSGMLPWAEEEAGPLPVGDVQAGRGAVALLALRTRRGVLL